MNLAYIRVFTAEQNKARQVETMRQFSNLLYITSVYNNYNTLCHYG